MRNGNGDVNFTYTNELLFSKWKFHLRFLWNIVSTLEKGYIELKIVPLFAHTFNFYFSQDKFTFDK